MVVLLVFLLAQLKLAIDQSDSKYKRAKAELTQSRRDLEARNEEVARRERDLRSKGGRKAPRRAAAGRTAPARGTHAVRRDRATPGGGEGGGENRGGQCATHGGRALRGHDAALAAAGRGACEPWDEAQRLRGPRERASRTPRGQHLDLFHAATHCGGDSDDLWLDEERVMGESRWQVFEVTSLYTGQKRAMKRYTADPDTGDFSTPDRSQSSARRAISPRTRMSCPTTRSSRRATRRSY